MTLLVALLSSVTLMCGGGFDQNEVECEEAVARLRECCPSLDTSHMHCHPDGCSGVTYPTLTRSDSICILNQSCGSISSANVCARTEAYASRQTSSYDDSQAPDTASHGVCP